MIERRGYSGKLQTGGNKSNGESAMVVSFLLPAAFFIGVFVIYPALYSIYLSLTNASLARPVWSLIGVRNYLDFFKDPATLQVLKNTYIYVFWVIVLQFVLGLGFALALNRVERFRGIYGAILFLPWVISDITAVSAWKWIFNDTYGLLNYYLGRIGLGQPSWLASPNLAMVAAIGLNVWKGAPFSMVIELAGLQSIPLELYEAAKVDGARPWEVFRFVTVPMMKFVMLANFILITIYTFNIFSLVYAFTGGGPLNYTEIIGLNMYRQAFTLGRLGYGSAIGVVMFVLNLVITAIYLKTIARRQVVDIQET
ncbi:MAG: sugar ABC transporter permease [Firmicutes bacterium]|nr:sugar ABC transporter permease [Bacillota bacterium]